MKSALTPNKPSLWLSRFPFPKPEGHKYDRGSALICGGSVMTGATRMAARSAQRVGAGLVTLAAPKSAYAIYAEALESVIVRAADRLNEWKELLDDKKYSAVLIGPGFGIGAEQREYVLAVAKSGKPCVLDADALTNFEKDPDTLLSQLHATCVLTPHEGEFARLFGRSIDGNLDKVERTQLAAKQAGCIVLLKGHETIIAQPDGEAIINTNAPAWTATAGAGDVLAGLILGLVAQHMPAYWAAAAAAWIHGQSAANFGPGLIAEDLIDGIPGVLRGLSESAKQG